MAARLRAAAAQAEARCCRVGDAVDALERGMMVKLAAMLDRGFATLEAAPLLAKCGLYLLLCMHSLYLLLCVELVFAVHTRFYLRAGSSHAPREKATQAERNDDADQAIRVWARLVDEVPRDQLLEVIRGWFRTAPLSSRTIEPAEPALRHGDVFAFVAWSVYGRSVQLPPAHVAEVSRIVRRIEARVGAALPAGREPGARFLSYTCDALEPCWKPLLFHVALWLLEAIFHAYIVHVARFELRTAGQLSYWRRAPRRRAPMDAAAPVCFVHGIGGLFGYVLMVRRLAATHDGALLLPLFPSFTVSQLPTLAAMRAHPSHREMISSLHEMTLVEGAPVFVAHSLGTAIVAALLKRHPASALGVLLSDAICFLIYTRSVAYNFLYARPPLWPRLERRAAADAPPSRVRAIFHAVQWRFVGTIPSVQSYFRREFALWANYALHPLDLPCDALVILSGRDTVADACAVYDHLRAHAPSARSELRVELHERWVHGYVMIGGRAARDIAAWASTRASQRPRSPQPCADEIATPGTTAVMEERGEEASEQGDATPERDFAGCGASGSLTVTPVHSAARRRLIAGHPVGGAHRASAVSTA